MSRPTHFDLAGAEATIRADMLKVADEALRKASTDNDRALVQLQVGLHDFVVAFALWDMRRVNNGGRRDDPNAASALGYILGNLIASYVGNSGDAALLDELMDRLWATACRRLSGDHEEDAVQSHTIIKATEGGNA